MHCMNMSTLLRLIEPRSGTRVCDPQQLSLALMRWNEFTIDECRKLISRVRIGHEVKFDVLDRLNEPVEALVGILQQRVTWND
jgi:hypothetical protein